MQKHHINRPIGVSSVSRAVLSSVRILIASYFLAMATGLILNPASRNLLDTVLPPAEAQFICTTYLFTTAFAIMVGMAVRPAALLLSVYVFWSGFLHYDFGNESDALASFGETWRFLGAILLIAVTEPGGSSRFNLIRRSINPRRIRLGQRGKTSASAQRLGPDEAQLARAALIGGVLVQTEVLPPLPDQDGSDDFENIFADLWDRAGVPAI